MLSLGQGNCSLNYYTHFQIGDDSGVQSSVSKHSSPAKHSGTSDYGTCTCSGSGGVGDTRGCNSVRTWTDSSSCHGDYNSDSELSVGSDDSTPNYEDLSTLRHTTSTDSDDDDSYFERLVALEILNIELLKHTGNPEKLNKKITTLSIYIFNSTKRHKS